MRARGKVWIPWTCWLAWAAAALPSEACEESPPGLPMQGTPSEIAAYLISTQSPKHLRRLREERLVIQSKAAEAETGGGTGDFIQAIVIFDKPPQQVFDLLTQTDRQAEYLKDLRSVETRSRHPAGSLEHFTLKILFKKIRYQVKHCWSQDPLQMWWQIDSAHDNDIRHVQGFWQLYPGEVEGSGTLARYGTRIDIGPLLPAFVQRNLTRKNLPAAMRSTRDWVDAGGEP